MSAIFLNNRTVHYEIVGRRGMPVIFLHSWLGSWRYWLPTMEYVSERYRAYALDFWGFGESDRRQPTFSISDYATMLHGFMNQMGMTQAVLVGHGLGGMVAVRAAVEWPNMFDKVMTVNAPVRGSQMQNMAKPGAFSRLLGRSHPANIWTRQLRDMKFSDTIMQKEIVEDTDSLPENVIASVLNSVLETDLTSDLGRMDTPLLAMYGGRDTMVLAERMYEESPSDESGKFRQQLTLPKSGHFPFLDQPTVFYRALMDYLGSSGNTVELKNEWRRRVSQLEYI